MSILLESSSSRGSFRLMRGKVECFELKYTNWFSSKAVASCNDQHIEIIPKNIWNSKFDIFKDGVDCGDIIFNWMGHVIIRLSRTDGADDDEFLLRHRGVLNSKYELITFDDQRVLTLKADYNWTKLKYNYLVEKEHHNFPPDVLNEFLIYCGFAANLHMTRSVMG